MPMFMKMEHTQRTGAISLEKRDADVATLLLSDLFIVHKQCTYVLISSGRSYSFPKYYLTCVITSTNITILYEAINTRNLSICK